MSKQRINSIEYIEEIVREKSVKEMILAQRDKLSNSIKIGLKVILFSKKWIIYLLLTFVNFIGFIVIDGMGSSYENPEETFLIVFNGNLFPFMFVFGCLLISLPISADEISDHTLDMYLVRPIKRETYWLSRWIVLNVVVYSINILIYFVYYLYLHAFAEQGVFVGLGENLPVFGGVAILIIPATLIYSSLFLFVGMIRDWGFTLSLLIAIFDIVFVSLFFLNNSPIIPLTNLNRIANSLLPDYVYFNTPSDLTLTGAWSYVFIFTAVVFVCGALYIRMREIK
jgi:hypothetical protein